VIHSRNLDFGNPAYLRNATYKAKFVKNGTYQYDTVMFGGIVGVYTGMKAGAFSISENERTPGGDHIAREALEYFFPGSSFPVGLLENVVLLFTGFKEISWVIQDTLAQCDSFECAHNKLSTEKIAAPGYIILAGTEPGEGVVITRDRFGVAHEDWISDNSSNGTKWYVVQTNSDHWLPDQCNNKSRCGAAHKNLDGLGQGNLTIDTLREKVLLQYPNQNVITIYNSNMIPVDSMIDSIPVPPKGHDDPNYEFGTYY